MGAATSLNEFFVWARSRCGRSGVLVGTIFGAALTVYLGYLLGNLETVVLGSAYSNSDAAFFAQAAWYRAFVDPNGGFAGEVLPMTPYMQLYTAAHRLFGPSLLAPLSMNAVAMAAGVAGASYAARRWFGVAAGWWTGAFGVLCAPFVFFVGLTIKTAMVLGCVGLAMAAMARFSASGGLVAFAITLALLTVGTLDRNNLAVIPMVWLGVACLGGYRRDGWRRLVSIAVVGLVAVISVVAVVEMRRPAVDSHMLSPVGLVFYVGNAPDATGGYTPIEGLRDDIVGHSTEGVSYVESRVDHDVSRSEATQYWVGRVWEYYRDRPMEYLKLVGRKVLLLLAAETYGFPEQYGVWRWVRAPLPIAFVGFAVVLGFGVLGLLPARRGEQVPTALRSPGGQLLMVAALAYAASVVVFLVTERYRLPLLMLLLPMAGHGMARLWTWRWRVTAVGIGVGMAVIGGSHYLTRLNDTDSGWARDKATQRSLERQRLERLKPVYEARIGAIRDGDASDWALLSGHALERGQMPDAVVLARKAIATEPSAIDGYLALARAALEVGDTSTRRQALAHLNDFEPQTRREAERILDFEAHLRESLVSSPDD